SLLTRRPGNAGLTKESTARELEARGRSMGARQTASYETTTVAGETVQCFIPRPLPPEEPPLQLDGEILERNRRAEQAIARLELAGAMVPSLDWFLYAFVRKEAVISSQIERSEERRVGRAW